MSRQLDKRKISLLGLEEKENVSSLILALKVIRVGGRIVDHVWAPAGNL